MRPAGPALLGFATVNPRDFGENARVRLAVILATKRVVAVVAQQSVYGIALGVLARTRQTVRLALGWDVENVE